MNNNNRSFFFFEIDVEGKSTMENILTAWSIFVKLKLVIYPRIHYCVVCYSSKRRVSLAIERLARDHDRRSRVWNFTLCSFKVLSKINCPSPRKDWIAPFDRYKHHALLF